MSLVALTLVMMLGRRFKVIMAVANFRILFLHALAAFLVAINWGVFIWASIHGNVLESGLGYLIAPFVSIGVGVLVMRDRLSWVKGVAIAIIILGVLLLLFRSVELSAWVYWVIGVTWGGYAYFKKKTTLDSFSGLFVETLALSILLIFLLLTTSLSMQLPESLSQTTWILLLLCGLVSVVPLVLFAFAVQNLKLSVMGLFQFVLPTTQLVVALVVYRQPLSHNSIISFSMIWIALALIVLESSFGNLKFDRIKNIFKEKVDERY